MYKLDGVEARQSAPISEQTTVPYKRFGPTRLHLHSHILMSASRIYSVVSKSIYRSPFRHSALISLKFCDHYVYAPT